MTPAVRWRPAEPDDHAALRDFACTWAPEVRREPRFERTYARSYEAEVQGLIRNLNVPRAARMGQRVIVGLDDEGLAAVGIWVQKGTGRAHLYLAAVAMRLRRTGDHGVADGLVVELLTDILRENDGDEVLVTALIHPDNGASQACASRAGFELVGPSDGERGSYDEWRLVVATD